jgi:hypothetical protein
MSRQLGSFQSAVFMCSLLGNDLDNGDYLEYSQGMVSMELVLVVFSGQIRKYVKLCEYKQMCAESVLIWITHL